jgi:hypothetical protein
VHLEICTTLGPTLSSFIRVSPFGDISRVWKNEVVVEPLKNSALEETKVGQKTLTFKFTAEGLLIRTTVDH